MFARRATPQSNFHRKRDTSVAQVARAAHHAHQKGVIHRDLKPTNVLVATIEDRPVPKIIDFGVAKSIHSTPSDQTQLTRIGQLIGTPEYMSPEQVASGGADVDVRTDVYSLGVVLYELIAGRRPYELAGDGLAGLNAWLARVKRKDLVRPSEQLGPVDARLLRRLRTQLDWVVLKALDPDRARRYDSAADLASDLESFLSDEPVAATPPRPLHRLRSLVSRNRTGFGLAAMTLLALVVGLGVASVGFLQASRERDLAATARDEAQAVADFLVETLSKADPSTGARHMTVLEVVQESANRIEGAFPGRPLVEARLRHTIGTTFWSLGEHSAAEQHLRAAVALRESQLGPGHNETLVSMVSLAGTLFRQRRLAEAEGFYQRAREGLRELGDVEKAAAVSNNLAQIRTLQGSYGEAERLQLEAHEAWKELLGATHRHTLGSLINLAEIRWNLGKVDEALSLLGQALADWTKALGERHPGTLLAMNNYAAMLTRGGRADEALPLYRKVAALRRDVLGPDHPETVTSEHNLAVGLYELGQPDEALQILESIVTAGEHREPMSIGLTTLVTLFEYYEKESWPQRHRQMLALAIRQLEHASRDGTDPGELNTVAWLLLDLPEPRGDRIALAGETAARAVRAARETRDPRLWMLLDTLAMAQHLAGDSEAAVTTQLEAIALAPEDAGDKLAELRQHLERYRAAISY